MNADQLSELQDRFNREKQAYFQLIGNLYPSICYQTLVEIHDTYVQMGGHPNDLIMPAPPSPSGYSPGR